jgi:hypothetical protein
MNIIIRLDLPNILNFSRVKADIHFHLLIIELDTKMCSRMKIERCTEHVFVPNFSKIVCHLEFDFNFYNIPISVANKF